MPEASIHEDGDAQPWEGDIGAATEARQGVMDSEPEATPVKQRPKGDLGVGIPLALRLHSAERVG